MIRIGPDGYPAATDDSKAREATIANTTANAFMLLLPKLLSPNEFDLLKRNYPLRLQFLPQSKTVGAALRAKRSE
jgi:hypothetical protein